MPNRLAERLVGGEGVEPFGLRLALVAQEVKQTQGLTRSLQLRRLRPRLERLLVEVVGFDVGNFGQCREILFAVGFSRALGQIVQRHQG